VGKGLEEKWVGADVGELLMIMSVAFMLGGGGEREREGERPAIKCLRVSWFVCRFVRGGVGS
jgi:hypothetical protein